MRDEYSRSYWEGRRGAFNKHLALAGLSSVVFAVVVGHPTPEPYALLGIPLMAVIVGAIGNVLYSMLEVSERIGVRTLHVTFDAWRDRVFVAVVGAVYAVAGLVSIPRLVRLLLHE